MKSLIAALTMVAMGLAYTGTGFAADKPEKKEGKKPEVATKQFTGTVESCDAACIKVKKGEETKTFTVNEKTKVATAEKKEGAIGDIKAGDKVTVLYAGEGDTAVAKRIMVGGAGKKK